MRARTATTATLALCLAAGAAAAHVRLHHPGNKKALYWPKPSNIKIAIDPSGSADVPGTSDITAIRLGLREWNADPGSKATLVETSFTVTNKCLDWEDFSVHLVFFDELDCTGYFGGGSGTVALTPVLFNNNGQIVDADVIFNGQDHSFTTSGNPAAFDIQDVGTHELGHLLGLDHSGWAGATMYPYVDQGLVLQRSLSQDDVHGLRHIAPQGLQSRIDGQVRRLSDGSGVAGAHVHAVDASGRSAGGALADGSGNYSLRGLDAGDYTVHAEPLDDPVNQFNLQSGHTIEIDFEAAAGPTVTVGAGKTVTAPDFSVDADVILSLGTGFDPLPLACRTGSVTAHTLTGVGLAPGSSLTASDPNLSVGALVWTGNAVDFTVGVPGGTTPGHVDLIATNGAERSVLVAAIEIVPPDPTVTNVTPATGNDIGGTAVTITGTGFRPGARVIIGQNVYEDGAAGGCTVVDDTTITLMSLTSSVGTYDVVVMDETGVEGRDTSAYTVAVMPVLATRFPAAGDSAGGTELILTGGNFLPGMTVRIDGAVQGSVVLEGTTVARVTTDSGAPGGPYLLEIEIPGGATAASAYSYEAQPDPVLLDVTPGSGSPSGGKLITLSGSGFTASTAVEFGADPLTGLGGTPAAAVTFIDASTLEVTTPAMSAGRVAVLVSEGPQASLVDKAFTFTASGGGGGGGCYMVPLDGPSDLGGPRDALMSGLWLALFAAAILGYARLTRRRALLRSAQALARL